MAVKTQKLENGNYITMAVAEVRAVPFFELFSKDLDRANAMNQIFFTQLLQSLHRRSDPERTAFEILYQSSGVDNQTYKAQVRMFVIVRRIGERQAENEEFVLDVIGSIKNDLEEKNYSVSLLDSEQAQQSFEASLRATSCGRVLAVSKNEKTLSNSMWQSGMIYYNEVLQPSQNVNLSALVNALTQYPESAVSMQIIPTKYSGDERTAIEQGKYYLSQLVSQIKYAQGLRVDANLQMAVDAYDYYSGADREELFFYNLVVYSDPNSARDLANKLLAAVEAEGKTSGSAMDLVELTPYALSPARDLFSSPWIVCDVLVNRARETSFWDSRNAPVLLKRLKCLMTVSELIGVFKLPIDDEIIIGLDSNKVSVNREKLHESVISEGSFKIGTIRNASRNGAEDGAQAGIALNDFTKHGLIVGMPGSGKTCFSLGLLLQFWKDFSIPFLAIEPTKSEYRTMIDEIPDIQIFTPGKNTVSPFIINPFLPPSGVTVESYVPSLMSAFEASFSMPEPLPAIFLSAINDCYNEYGWRLDSTKDDPGVRCFGMYEFIRAFKRKVRRSDYRGEVKANMEAAGVVRLITLIEQNSNIYDTIHTIPLEDLLRKPTIIELNAINNREQKALIMALLLIMICTYTKNNVRGDGKLKNIMLIDEAHVLLAGGGSAQGEKSDAQGTTVEAIENMIAEIRAYGTGIIIADQSPTKVGGVIENTNVKVIFKLVERKNKDVISASTNMSDADCDLLGRLGQREALLHHGRINSPLHIKAFDLYSTASIRQSVEDAEVAARTEYWKTHRELLVPHIECGCCAQCADGCDLKLRTNADFIASRLIIDRFYELPDKKAFVQYLVRMDGDIEELLGEYPDIPSGARLINCVKIKFLRKAMLKKDFGITKKEYAAILRHPRFLKSGERGSHHTE